MKKLLILSLLPVCCLFSCSSSLDKEDEIETGFVVKKDEETCASPVVKFALKCKKKQEGIVNIDIFVGRPSFFTENWDNGSSLYRNPGYGLFAVKRIITNDVTEEMFIDYIPLDDFAHNNKYLVEFHNHKNTIERVFHDFFTDSIDFGNIPLSNGDIYYRFTYLDDAGKEEIPHVITFGAEGLGPIHFQMEDSHSFSLSL